MEPSAFAAQRRSHEPQWGVSSSASRASEADDLLGAYADKFRKEGWYAAAAQYQVQLDEKDKEIAELKAKIAMQESKSAIASIVQSGANPYDKYKYNASHFPKPNAESIIDALIELANSKREGDKHIIHTKTDWYMVWKVLLYFKIYTGNEYDFIDIVNDCVIPNLDTKFPQKRNALSTTNFKGIKKDSPMKKISVDKWRNELEKQRENPTSSPIRHGTLALDRGINIKVKLQKLLQLQGVESYYYEKQSSHS